MCLILDTNLFSDYMNNTQDMAPVRRWLEGTSGSRRKGKLAYSPTAKFKAEVNQHPFKNKLIKLSHAGIVKAVPVAKVEKVESELPQLKSDDPHIVALAIAGRVSLLVSKDKDLHQDFKELAGGKVYQKAAHKHLLTPDLCD